MRKIILTILVLLISMTSCSGLASNSKTTSIRTVKQDDEYEKTINHNSPAFQKYANKKYAVGTDIPSGDYVVYGYTKLSKDNFWVTGRTSGNIKITEDEYGFNVLREENIFGIDIVTLQNDEFVFIEDCYLVPIEATFSFRDNGYSLSLYDDFMSSWVTLKVGYHIPEGTYVFDSVNVYVYGSLVTRNEFGNKIRKAYIYSAGSNKYSKDYSPYSIVSLKEGDYVSINADLSLSDFSKKCFLSLEVTKDFFEIREHGSYVVGYHLPSGVYTLGADRSYNSYIGWDDYGRVTIWDNYEELSNYDQIYINYQEPQEFILLEGQMIDFESIKILSRRDITEEDLKIIEAQKENN